MIPALRARVLPLAVCAAASLVAGPLRAQGGPDADDDSTERSRLFRAPDRVLFTATAALASTANRWLGKTPDRGVFITGLRAEWRLSGSERRSAGYFAEFIPVAVVSNNPDRFRDPPDCARTNPQWRELPGIPVIEYFERCGTRSVNAFGAGVTPLGLSARFARSGGVALQTELSAGAIVFNRTVPYPNATRLNYSLIAGTVLELPLRGGSILTVGYQMQHLSNGGMGEFNPGILAHALQMGWGRRR